MIKIFNENMISYFLSIYKSEFVIRILFLCFVIGLISIFILNLLKIIIPKSSKLKNKIQTLLENMIVTFSISFIIFVLFLVFFYITELFNK